MRAVICCQASWWATSRTSTQRSQKRCARCRLTHLTAVSGSNILIVAGVVVALCARLRTPWWVRILPAAAVTAGYVFIVGPEPSVMRATAMASLVAVGILRPAGTPTLAVLATAVTVLLIGRPHLATEIGFGLSVCATAALVVLSPPLTRALTDRGMPRPVAVALAVPVAAQAGCTPLLVVLDPTVSPWAVLANVAAAPAVAPATVLGLAGLGLEGIAAALPDALGMPPHLLARTAGALGAAAAWWITVIAHGCASLPGAALGWPTGPGGVVVAAGMVAGLACALLGRRRARTAGALVAVSCLLAGLAVPVVTATGRGAWSIVVCDVGQGSAALIRSRDAPRDHALLVDTGDDPALLAACMEGAGITRLHDRPVAFRRRSRRGAACRRGGGGRSRRRPSARTGGFSRGRTHARCRHSRRAGGSGRRAARRRSFRRASRLASSGLPPTGQR